MNEFQHQQLNELIEEVRAMRETQYEMMQEIKELRVAIPAVAKAVDDMSFDVRDSISGAAERIVEALERN
jgi:uncharacterized coiled-coil DUF342 family protein